MKKTISSSSSSSTIHILDLLSTYCCIFILLWNW